MGLEELRAQFEADLLKSYPNANINRKANTLHGCYASTKTQGYWLGYRLYHNASWSLESESRNRPVGKFIVAQVDNIGLIHPTRTPYLHQTKRQAKNEAHRLMVGTDKSFAILRCIDVKSPKETVDTAPETH